MGSVRGAAWFSIHPFLLRWGLGLRGAQGSPQWGTLHSFPMGSVPWLHWEPLGGL